MIASVHNRRVVDAARLSRRRDREETRTFLVDGPRAVLAAIRSGASVRQVFHVARSGAAVDEAVQEGIRRGAPTAEVSHAVMARLASTVTPQGVVAVVGFLDVPIRAVGPAVGLVAVLVEVADPGNAGTIVRTADAAGADAVVCTAGSVDLYNPKVVRASAGSLFHLPMVRDVDAAGAIGHLRASGFAVVAADAAGPASVYDADLTGPTAVLFGNEAHGLRPDLLEAADAVVRVPMAGRAESLNLAAAAAVILFEAGRRRSLDSRLHG